MTKNNDSFRWVFFASLVLILVLSFFIQTKLFNFSPSENKLTDGYIINAIMAITIFVAIERIKKIKPEIAGFVFMGGSALKFLVFFMVFYPFYKQDGTISKAEFLSFFTPYALSLVVEVFFLMKSLNELKK
jgi:hypothetical protein